MLAKNEILEPNSKNCHSFWVNLAFFHSYQKYPNSKGEPPILTPFWKQAISHQTCPRRNSTMPLHPFCSQTLPPGPTRLRWVWAKQRGQEAQSYRENLQMAWHTVKFSPQPRHCRSSKKPLLKKPVFFQQKMVQKS